jgi:glycosyltransferase involved in cell wall biosynthesis
MPVSRSPIKVLHVAQPLTEGVPRSVALLLRDQVERGLSVTVACPRAADTAEFARSLGAAHIPWEAVRNPGPSVVREARSLARVVASLRPDILHLHSSKAGLAGRLAVRHRVATVFQPRAWSFEAVDGVLRAGALSWERFAVRWTHVIVCVSEAERERGREHGITANWRVVPNGVDLGRYTPAGDEDRRLARRRLGLDHAPLAVCIGRISREKGQDVLLDAWPLVRGRVTARLALVGDGAGRWRLEQRRVPGTLFVGTRLDVEDWLAAADVLVLPSRWEGMALVMLEAMARARSVVATDVSGAREALHPGAGAVVPVENTVALAEAVAERLLDPTLAAAEGSVGRARAEERHDARRTGAAITALYEELLDGSA